MVAQQALRNPTPDDGDPEVPTDLPYACEAPYSRKAKDFRAPTRVVGRLPDATGASNPRALKAVIATAAKWKLRSRDHYEQFLGITARVWRGSTAMSLRNTFGTAAGLKTSPTDGPRWQQRVLDNPMHFINCHGSPMDPYFYGQRGNSYPIAHSAARLEGKVADGTVVAAECCYGAELYDAGDAGGQAGIVATYMTGGAYGFLGSSTIAYGPAEGNGAADLICQYFLQRVLRGASLGRATLEARQRFVRETSVLDPVDLKTLAQFDLMGDPSIHPVRRRGKAADTEPDAGARGARRANLLALGLALEDSRSYAEPRTRPLRSSEAVIESLRERFDLPDAAVTSYTVEAPAVLERMKADGPLPEVPDAIHLLLAPLEADIPGRQFRAVVAFERSGEVISVRDLYTR